MKRSILYTFILSASLLLLSSCKKDDGDSSSSSDSLAGSYKISSSVTAGCNNPEYNIDATFDADGCTVVEGKQYCATGNLNFSADGKYTNTLEIENVSEEETTEIFEPGSGTYVRSGSVLTICDSDDDCENWTVSGNTIVLTEGPYSGCTDTVTLTKS